MLSLTITTWRNQKMKEMYFKKPTGIVFKVNPNHNIDSLKSRFVECDEKGNEIKKEVKKEV